MLTTIIGLFRLERITKQLNDGPRKRIVKIDIMAVVFDVWRKETAAKCDATSGEY